jgi:hypothetical protein
MRPTWKVTFTGDATYPFDIRPTLWSQNIISIKRTAKLESEDDCKALARIISWTPETRSALADAVSHWKKLNSLVKGLRHPKWLSDAEFILERDPSVKITNDELF